MNKRYRIILGAILLAVMQQGLAAKPDPQDVEAWADALFAGTRSERRQWRLVGRAWLGLGRRT